MAPRNLPAPAASSARRPPETRPRHFPSTMARSRHSCRNAGRRWPRAGRGNCGATLPWLTESGEAEFPAVVEQSSLPVLVDFWAPWCGPCRIVSPIVEKIASELPGRLKLAKVNSDDAPNLSRRFGIRGIPTLVLIDHGTEVARVTGALPAPALRSWVDQHLPKPAAKPSA